jgi:ApaG protein
MLSHAGLLIVGRIAATLHDREPGITRELWVGVREATQVELRPAPAREDLDVRAAAAESDWIRVDLPGFPSIVHHAAMFTSEALTRGVRVRVESEYAPDRSQPCKNQWFFLYTVTISNEGGDTIQLLTRHWIITDGTGNVQEVRGPGVVGKQPTLKPGDSFEYTSGCELTTAFGVMEGSYQMISDVGERFDVRIAPFTLSEPYTVH